ncbi:hypothetical protein [Bradyrhizobium sp.]|uniref:hypothetical protein n=1 Tax=Bradyrhizobium sp. TaxID=376 RepID=UPI002D6DF409|nr:hypothetical protein [Bradyrhizobium sp.]HZR74551.1 hypothetical protein [Bradyrhizobium sp.]
MAKIAEVVKPATPQKIATAKRLIEAGEQEIAALRTALSAALLSEDDSEAIKITEKIAAIEKRIALNQQKLAALGKQGRKERTADREQRKTEALAAFEKSLSETAGIAAKIDKAVDDLAAALKEYRAAKRKPFDKWPADLFPSLKIFEGFMYGYADNHIGAALHMKSPGNAHTLLTALPERLGSLAEADIKSAAALIADIKSMPLPAVRDDTESEAA